MKCSFCNKNFEHVKGAERPVNPVTITFRDKTEVELLACKADEQRLMGLKAEREKASPVKKPTKKPEK